MREGGLIAAGALLVLLAGCASKPAPQPAPAPVRLPPQPAPAPKPSPTPPADWRDLPLTPGEWFYGGASADVSARFGAAFTVRCERASRRLVLEREGGAGAMTIRTSAGARAFAGSSAALSASDGFLDAIIFSRGRFTVESTGLPILVIPAWPEPARVIEECRS